MNPFMMLRIGLVVLAIGGVATAYFIGKRDGKVLGNKEALEAYIETLGEINEVDVPDDPDSVLRELCELADFKPDRCRDL